jgi:hypothetical protein
MNAQKQNCLGFNEKLPKNKSGCNQEKRKNKNYNQSPHNVNLFG